MSRPSSVWATVLGVFRMHLKLRGRVLLLTLAVAFAAVTLASLVLNTLLARGFSRYLHAGERSRMTSAVEELANYYEKHRTWAGIEEEIFLPGTLLAVEDAEHRPILVQRFRGRGMMYGMPQRQVERLPIALSWPDDRLGGLSHAPGLWSTQAERELRGAIDEALLLGGISAAIFAVLLGLMFARHLTDPLGRIEEAARAMARGDLGRRAKVRGDDELTLLAGTLNDLAARVQSLLDERRQLSADLAHELRTPLAVIRSLIESFADGVLPPDRENLAQVREEVDRLQELTERIQQAFLAGEQAPAKQTLLDLGLLAGRLAVRMTPRYAEKGIALECKVPEGQRLMVRGDGDALSMAVGNLLDNALKYGPPGTSVTLALQATGPEVILSVHDRGIGIAPEHLPHIFDRLYRADPSRSRDSGGYGLGLAIAREIAEAHGGVLTVASEVGRGSTFTLTLPRVE